MTNLLNSENVKTVAYLGTSGSFTEMAGLVSSVAGGVVSSVAEVVSSDAGEVVASVAARVVSAGALVTWVFCALPSV